MINQTNFTKIDYNPTLESKFKDIYLSYFILHFHSYYLYNDTYYCS